MSTLHGSRPTCRPQAHEPQCNPSVPEVSPCCCRWARRAPCWEKGEFSYLLKEKPWTESRTVYVTSGRLPSVASPQEKYFLTRRRSPTMLAHAPRPLYSYSYAFLFPNWSNCHRRWNDKCCKTTGHYATSKRKSYGYHRIREMKLLPLDISLYQVSKVTI
jgi:hypothetical protein